MFVTVVHAMLFVIILVNVLCGSYNTVTNLGILCTTFPVIFQFLKQVWGQISLAL